MPEGSFYEPANLILNALSSFLLMGIVWMLFVGNRYLIGNNIRLRRIEHRLGLRTDDEPGEVKQGE